MINLVVASVPGIEQVNKRQLNENGICRTYLEVHQCLQSGKEKPQCLISPYILSLAACARMLPSASAYHRNMLVCGMARARAVTIENRGPKIPISACFALRAFLRMNDAAK